MVLIIPPLHDKEGNPLYTASKQSTPTEKAKALADGYPRFWAYFGDLINNFDEYLKQSQN